MLSLVLTERRSRDHVAVEVWLSILTCSKGLLPSLGFYVLSGSQLVSRYFIRDEHESFLSLTTTVDDDGTEPFLHDS